MDKALEKEYLRVLESIQKIDADLSKSSRKNRRIHRKLNLLRSEQIVAIGSDKDEKEKLKFSNERMREAELAIRLNKIAEYEEFLEEQFDIEDKHSELVAEQNKLIDLKIMMMVKMGLPVLNEFTTTEMVGLH